MGLHRIIFRLTQGLAPSISRIAIHHLGTHIHRLVIFTIGTMLKSVATCLFLNAISRRQFIRLTVTTRQEDNTQGNDYHTKQRENDFTVRLS